MKTIDIHDKIGNHFGCECESIELNCSSNELVLKGVIAQDMQSIRNFQPQAVVANIVIFNTTNLIRFTVK